jgi:hypothetical protein
MNIDMNNYLFLVDFSPTRFFPWGLLITVCILAIRYVYKPRICPKCNIKMQQHLPPDSFVPDFYICKKCGKRIETNARMSNQSTPD